MSLEREQLRERGLVIATNNLGKLHEFRRLLEPLEIEVMGYADLGVDLDVLETEETFEGNAILKALASYEAVDRPVIADDSGLAVDALDGAPGVYSARYGGDGLDDAGRRRHLLDNLREVPDKKRTARFVCVLALSLDGSRESVRLFRGTAEGRVLGAERGEGGFGYDPIFLDPASGKSFAELDAAQKDARSHRGAAIRKFVDFLRQ